MTRANSTGKASPSKTASVLQPPTTAKAKPAKPYPTFPLTPHPAGYWCKKIRGRLHYFGKIDDPDGALAKYNREKDALHAGRTPRDDSAALTVKALVNLFLHHKQSLVDAGELGRRSWQDYKDVADLLVANLGKHRLVDDIAADDFAALRTKLAKRWGPVRLVNVLQRIRSVFKYGTDNGIITKTPVYGQGFKGPSKKVLRLHRAKQGVKLFTADEVRRMFDAADVQLKAMILLGINCGFGMADCGTLPKSALDLTAGWVDFPRQKTGINRRCPLWPETVEALRAALANRKEPKDEADADLVFVTYQGQSWHKPEGSSPAVYKVGQLLKKLGINGRKGIGFYTFRHSFRTIADEARDQPAADFIMGHARDDMASVYRERIGDDRLQAVADHVRAWLFPETATAAKPRPKRAKKSSRAVILTMPTAAAR